MVENTASSRLSIADEKTAADEVVLPVIPIHHITKYANKREEQEQCIGNININQFVSLDKFDKLLIDYMEELSCNISNYDTTEKCKGRKKRKRKYNSEDEGNLTKEDSACVSHLIPEPVFGHILSRCHTDESFWSETAMKSIIYSKSLPRRFYPLVFKCLFKYNALDLLEACTSSLANVPEACIVDSVKYLVRSDATDKSSMKASSETLRLVTCPVSSPASGYLLIVLTFSFDDHTLQSELARLTQNEALVLIQYLRYLLALASPALYSSHIADNVNIPESLTEKKILIWLELLLTTHLLSFVSSPSLRPLLMEIRKTFRHQIRFYKDLHSVGPYLEYFHKPFTLPPRSAIGIYTFETITL